MDENLDQCFDKSAATTPNDICTGNQEIPDDLKDQNASRTEARKLGATPSSLDLPKINLAEFDKWKSVVNESKALPLEQTCSEEQAAVTDEELVCAAPALEESPDSKEVCAEDRTEEPVCSEERVEDQTCSEEIDNTAPQELIKDESGRTIREKFASGPDVVVAYDENGEAHRFTNEPIKEMPPNFAQVPDWRQSQLDDQSNEMLERYAGAKTAGDYEKLDFQKVADMQKEIAQRQDLTETEKCLLYTKIQNIMHDKPIPVESWNEKPRMVDSWTGERDPWHAIAPLDDKYHNRLLKMSPEDASKAIYEQEDSTEGDMHDSALKRYAWKTARLVLGMNEGDVNASEAQLKAMRELKEKGTFGAYAEEWEKQYVNKDAVDPRGGESGTF